MKQILILQWLLIEWDIPRAKQKRGCRDKKIRWYPYLIREVVIYVHTKYHCNWMKNVKIISKPKQGSNFDIKNSSNIWFYIGRTIKLFNSSTYLIRIFPLRTSPPHPFLHFTCHTSHVIWRIVRSAFNMQATNIVFFTLPVAKKSNSLDFYHPWRDRNQGPTCKNRSGLPQKNILSPGHHIYPWPLVGGYKN